MKLGIAARQIDRIGIGRRRLVGERRERQNLGASGAPALEQRRIGEGEGGIARHRDALAERRDRAARRCERVSRADRPGQGQQRIDIDRCRESIGGRVEKLLEIVMLAGLHQAEMAFGQAQAGRRAARSPARECRAPSTARVSISPVAGAADPIEDDAGDVDARAMAGEAAHQRAGGSSLAPRIDHENDRPAA